MTRTFCEELADRIVDYVDGELPPEEAQSVARHLSECPRCRQTASDLKRSLGLVKAIWLDNLADTKAVPSDAVGATPRGCPPKTGRHGGLPLRYPHVHAINLGQRGWLYAVAVAAVILLATGSSLLLFFQRAPQPPALTFEDVQRQVERTGTAAQLLAATRILAQCEGTGSLVKQQYRYILREYADTPAAASIQANEDL